MNLSVFEACGPVMIGPSSSHTAGPAKLGRVARRVASAVCGQDFSRVTFGLHGSFAKTGLGHGTRLALTAGVLGLKEDDERLPNAFGLAKDAGLSVEFYETELDGYHENSVLMTFYAVDGQMVTVAGSSTGGGRIVIKNIGGFDAEFTAQAPSLIAFWKDVKGIMQSVSRLIAESGVNIGVMRLNRKDRGGEACCVIETDSVIDPSIVAKIRAIPNVISAIEIEGA